MASKDSQRRASLHAAVPEQPVLMGPPPIPRFMPIFPDPHFNNENIPGLNLHNFSQYTSRKEKALIMFYNSKSHDNPCLDKAFIRASVKQYPDYHGFAAVDCSINDKLCEQERICPTPMMKLYSNGFEVSRIEDMNFISAVQLYMLMKMTPVLTQPKMYLNQMPDPTPSKRKVVMGTKSLRRK